ncbi:MAG: hypothetical protein J3K34DRAFT_411234, partial [Monoraphidium minutum]
MAAPHLSPVLPPLPQTPATTNQPGRCLYRGPYRCQGPCLCLCRGRCPYQRRSQSPSRPLCEWRGPPVACLTLCRPHALRLCCISRNAEPAPTPAAPAPRRPAAPKPAPLPPGFVLSPGAGGSLPANLGTPAPAPGPMRPGPGPGFVPTPGGGAAAAPVVYGPYTGLTGGISISRLLPTIVPGGGLQPGSGVLRRPRGGGGDGEFEPAQEQEQPPVAPAPPPPAW